MGSPDSSTKKYEVPFFGVFILYLSPPLHNSDFLIRQAVELVHQRVNLRLKRRYVRARINALGREDALNAGFYGGALGVGGGMGNFFTDYLILVP
jgi:uncharacterized membrane protein YfcA